MKETVDSRQINAFVALARCGSFTLAAKELFLTQSAVSHAIKALEDDLGCRLVDRLGRRVRLTPKGEQFLKHAEGILRQMKSARGELETLSKWEHHRLRIGACTVSCRHLLPWVLQSFRSSYPRCIVGIEVGSQAVHLERLRAHQVDLALLLEPLGSPVPEIEFVPLFEDEMRLIVTPGHPWAEMDAAPHGTFERETLILFSKKSYTFQLLSDYLKDEGATIGNIIELGNMDAVKELVKLGLGVGLLASWMVRSELADGTLVSLPFGARKLRRQWSIAYWRGRQLDLLETTFVDLCQTASRNLIEPELRAAS